jgi:hypothetical protein
MRIPRVLTLALCTAALCGAGNAAAQSAAALTAHSGHAAPGQPGVVVFDIDFGPALTQASSLNFDLLYDTTALQLDPVTSSQTFLAGGSSSALLELNSLGTRDFNPAPDGLHFSWFAMDALGNLLTLPSVYRPGTFTFIFQPTAQATPATNYAVSLSLSVGDQNFADLGQATATGAFAVDSAPVPEPAAWILALFGLAALGARKRWGSGRQPA